MKIPERKHDFMCSSRFPLNGECDCTLVRGSFAQRTSEPFEITCVKDVVMNESEEVAFRAGETYTAWLCSDGVIDAFNEAGGEHTICDNDTEMKVFYNEHFRG